MEVGRDTAPNRAQARRHQSSEVGDVVTALLVPEGADGRVEDGHVTGGRDDEGILVEPLPVDGIIRREGPQGGAAIGFVTGPAYAFVALRVSRVRVAVDEDAQVPAAFGFHQQVIVG